MNSRTSLGWTVVFPIVATGVFSLLPPAFGADGTYFLASGRWDNTIVVIDLVKALDSKNDGTSNAVVNRLRVTPDIDAKGAGKADTPAGGQPINVVIAPDHRYAYVVNHSGRVSPELSRAFQHGHPGTVTVVNIEKALDPTNNGTLNAVDGYIETEGAGPTGFAIAPNGTHAFLAHAEQLGDEDGGREIKVIDLATRKVVGKITQAFGDPGFPCPPNPIPHAAPHPHFGCFPDTNGITISLLGGGTLFTGNGGTDDVSVINVAKALAGDPGAEIARIPVQTGPFGIGTSPDGRHVVVANRESARADAEGNTISILDVEKALADPKKAEVARVLVGTNNPATRTRPFAAAFTPDGQRIVVTNFRSNNVSIVDLKRALANEPAEIARINFETPSGAPSRPRGIAFTPDGRFAAITGAPRGAPHSGVVWILDLATLKVAGRVTEVGNEAYLIDTLATKR